MKELSIEEKAKAYDGLIERLKDLKFACRFSPLSDTIDEIFPELKESEGEGIRKAIIKFFELQDDNTTYSFIPKKDILAWLEKQGEQKPNPYSGTSFEYNGHTWGMCARDNGVEILIDGHIKGRVFTDDSHAKEMFIKALERVEEQNNKGYKLTDCDKNSWWEDFKAYASCTIQKPADKVEPKFHEGEWITNGDYTWQIVMVKSLDYILQSQGGNIVEDTISHVDENFHSFVIQDAKDGDVLAWDDSKCIALFKNIYDEDSFNSYGFVGGCTGTFESRQSYHDIEGAHPATKEQRGLLFQKMKEAGHEWDAEKKELKKMEQKPAAWSEEDEDIINKILCICNDFKRSSEISPASTKVIQKDIDKIDSWLKSLRHRSQWKPSDEQIKSIKEAACYSSVFSEKTINNLISLSEQLKNLREEQL